MSQVPQGFRCHTGTMEMGSGQFSPLPLQTASSGGWKIDKDKCSAAALTTHSHPYPMLKRMSIKPLASLGMGLCSSPLTAKWLREGESALRLPPLLINFQTHRAALLQFWASSCSFHTIMPSVEDTALDAILTCPPVVGCWAQCFQSLVPKFYYRNEIICTPLGLKGRGRGSLSISWSQTLEHLQSPISNLQEIKCVCVLKHSLHYYLGMAGPTAQRKMPLKR